MKICVTSVQSVGCTFVDWSIHFLAGRDQYFNMLSNAWMNLSQDPVSNINAHGHRKNHPSGFDATKLLLDHLPDQADSANLYSMYPVPLHLDLACSSLGINVDDLNNKTNLNKVTDYVNNDYEKIFDLCNQHNVKIVFVDSDARTCLYHQNIRSLDRFMTSPGKPKSKSDVVNEHQNIFFKHSLQQWSELGLTNVWDIRERMALDSRPFELKRTYKFDKTYPHLWINSLDLWTRTTDVLTKIMQYLELEIDNNRLQRWLPICTKWQKKQLDLLEFCYNQPHIVDAIVNNLYYEIDLTFEQEVIIQHCLIYQHNLNLKTWDLEKFPNNTQDLHKLLEPNIHPLEHIHNARCATHIC